MVRFGLLIGAVMFGLLAPVRWSSAQSVSMALSVDATDIGRNLVKSRLSLPVTRDPSTGTMEMRYIVWTPGNHTPSGPVENIASLVFKADDDASPLAWDRDPAAVERFTVRVPEGAKTLRVELSYIAGQPNVNSRTSDSYGRGNFGIVNWNTVLLYPAGVSNQQIDVQATLARPTGWRFASALQSSRGDETTTHFDAVPLAELIDCPVILGEHVESWRMDVPGEAPHFYHTVAAEAEQAKVPEWMRAKLNAMIAEGMAVMPIYPVPGSPRDPRLPFPRERYHFLHSVGMTGFTGGLEHSTSTLIGSGAKVWGELEKNDLQGGGAAVLVIPHEYFHVWCGKLRAPAGLVRTDYSTPPDTSLLWLYEGLTDYYTDVLGVRSGMITLDEFKQTFADLLSIYEMRSGRLWRSVEDTARAARHLRNPSIYWAAMRQGQEYYGQGAMFWMEADLLIRRASGGTKSLDDFCRAFFDVPVRAIGDQATFTREDVAAALKSLDPATDWDALIRARIESPASTLDLSPLAALAGVKLEFTNDPTPLQKKQSGKDSELNLRTSLGVRLNKDGEITDLIPGSAADTAGLAYGMKIIAVNNFAWSTERMKEAVKQSPERGAVDVIVSFQERVEAKWIAHGGGMRWPRVTPVEGETDWLAAIANPLVEKAAPEPVKE